MRRVKDTRLPPSLAYTLLRRCGTPKFNYMCMTNPPQVMKPLYEHIDALIVDAFSAIIGCTNNVFEPHGGALTSFVKEGPVMYKKTQQRISNTAASTPEEESNSEIPSTTPFGSHVRSAMGNHAATFMAHTAENKMSALDFTTALQHRCGHWDKTIGPHCVCGHQFGDDAHANYAHILTCTHNTFGPSHRHGLICCAMHKVLQSYGLPSYQEPQGFSGDDDAKRPDGAVHLQRATATYDVTCVTNTCPTYCGMKDPAAASAAAKKSKHGANSKAAGAEFFPISIETSGHVHPDFDLFVSMLSNYVGNKQKKQFRREMCFAISTSLQSGNARIINACKHKIRLMKSPEGFASPSYVG